MAIRIGGDTSNIQRQLNLQTKKNNSAFAQLSSGKRINKAADDAAGLAIAEALRADAAVVQQASRNSADVRSVLDIGEGTISNVNSQLIRMKELAVQAANGTLSDEQRTALNAEYQQLASEIDRQGQTTTFNGQQILTGNPITAQVGTTSGSESQISVTPPTLSSSGLGLGGTNIGTQAGALSALDPLTNAINTVSSKQAEFGAAYNRLTTVESNLATSFVTIKAAESQIRDVDVASAAADRVSAQIGQQGSVALLAQANLSAQNVLRLLS